MYRFKRSAVLLASASALFGCGELEQDLATTDGSPNISFEEFKNRTYKEPWEGGLYIVDNDIPMTDEEELRAYYDQATAGGDALTVNQSDGEDLIWEASRYLLTYCISNSFGSRKQEVVDTMEIATASWSDRIAVRYTYVPGEDDNCDADNGNVLFDVRPVDGVPYLARSFFPGDPRSDRNLLIDDEAFTTNFGGVDFDGILRHELGHTLAFRHEHIWLDGGCTGEEVGEARQVTSYDVNSVMHYPQCRPSGSGGLRQTDLDFAGAQSLYGTAAGVVLASTSSLL